MYTFHCGHDELPPAGAEASDSGPQFLCLASRDYWYTDHGPDDFVSALGEYDHWYRWELFSEELVADGSEILWIDLHTGDVTARHVRFSLAVTAPA